MVKHIVMWKLKDEANGNDKATNARLIKEKLENLNGKIACLLKLEVGLDFMGEGNYDVVLYSEFAHRDDVSTYANHPLHQAILPFIREANCSRVAVDYEV